MRRMSGGSRTTLQEEHASAKAKAQVQENTAKGAQASNNSQPRSSDMIPAMCNLSHEVRMADAELSDDTSTLGKRAAAGDQVIGTGEELGNKALVIYANTTNPAERVISGTPKKRKTLGSLDGQQTQLGGEMADQDMKEGSIMQLWRRWSQIISLRCFLRTRPFVRTQLLI